MCADVEQKDVDFLFALGGLEFLLEFREDLAEGDVLGAFFQLAVQFPVLEPLFVERFVTHSDNAGPSVGRIHEAGFGRVPLNNQLGEVSVKRANRLERPVDKQGQPGEESQRQQHGPGAPDADRRPCRFLYLPSLSACWFRHRSLLPRWKCLLVHVAEPLRDSDVSLGETDRREYHDRHLIVGWQV